MVGVAKRLAAGVVGSFVGVQVALLFNFGRPIDADDVVPMVLGAIAGLMTYAMVLLAFADEPVNAVSASLRRWFGRRKPGE